jgi:outer membrane receptor protein involved in Fe transport
MRTVRLLALCFVHLVLFTAQNAFAQNGAITGVVEEGTRGSGRLVSGATVTIDGTTNRATTNALGRFRLEGVAPGRVALTIEAPGYLNLRVPDVQVQPGASAELIIGLDVTPNILERVQVTATREPVSAGDIPALTSVVTQAEIQERGEQTLVQALNHVPGAVVSTQLGIFESIMLRGVPRESVEFSRVLVLIDGVPQTLANNSARVVALPINDTGAIEVFRGPNSAVYGRSAVGGVVNVRTANPTPEHNASFNFTGGQFGFLKGMASAAGPIRDWGGYYVSAASERNHGFMKSKTGDLTSGNSAQFGKFTFAPDSKSFGSITGNHVVSDSSTPTNEPIINGQFLHDLDPRYDRLTSFNIPGPNYHQSEGRATLNYTREFASWVKFVETAGYRRVQHKFINDGDFIGSPYDTVNNLVTMYPFSQQLDEDVYFQEARLEFSPRFGDVRSSATFGHSYEWNGGGIDADFIYTDEDLFGFPINYLNPVIPPIGDWQHDVAAHRSYHQGIHGVFGQFTIDPVSRLTLTAGGRFDRLKLDHTRGSNAKIEKTIDAFSPKASATVRLLGVGGGSSSTLNVYGTYGQSFIPPRRPSALNNVDPPLDPVEIENYEGGLKGSVLNGRVAMEAGYFWTKEDGVVLNRQIGPQFLPTNAGEIRYKGVETGIDVAVSSKVHTYFNAAFYRSRFGEFVIQSAGGDTVLTGNRLPVAPDRVVNWGASFDPTPAVNFNVNLKHVGPSQSDNDNTFEIPKFTTVDAAVSWRRGPVRVTLSAHNLFDEEYYWTGGETADPGTPRQVLLGMEFNFR